MPDSAGARLLPFQAGIPLGTEVPALYDAFIDKEGNLYGMDPQPPELHDMMQVVIENVGGRLTDRQKGCLTFLIKINGVSEVFLYKGQEFAALPVPQL
ncbi:hypothetical protein HFO97_22260 [Rhizobium leguminosarum]|uniref:hypothetical protein n=1 Tax=Rhizobium leguminosarum TaxID=384 RepID=UPI001C96CE20|nr:hypothetical protein [Rhizobium leguminosarum]MBY5362619.1 hypothetical protein [Rhizobium leguminosarum]